jgi:hypothetical protein
MRCCVVIEVLQVFTVDLDRHPMPDERLAGLVFNESLFLAIGILVAYEGGAGVQVGSP